MALSKRMSSVPSTEGDRTTSRPTRCPRCQGLMVFVRYEDWGSTTNAQTLFAWDCVQCGEVIDPVILANRARRLKPTRDRGRMPSAM